MGLDFTDTSAWHCIVVSLDSSGITYLVDETKNGTGMLSESQATNVSAADVEFGSIATDIGMVIRMPNALTLDQMYTLKRSTQEPFLGSRFSVCPFSFSSGSLVINVSASASSATAYATYRGISMQTDGSQLQHFQQVQPFYSAMTCHIKDNNWHHLLELLNSTHLNEQQTAASVN